MPMSQSRGGAVGVSERSGRGGGKNAADSRHFRERGFQGNELASGSQLLLQLGQRYASFHGDGHVGGLVVQDPVQLTEVQDHVYLVRAIAEALLGAASGGENGGPFSGRPA